MPTPLVGSTGRSHHATIVRDVFEAWEFDGLTRRMIRTDVRGMDALVVRPRAPLDR